MPESTEIAVPSSGPPEPEVSRLLRFTLIAAVLLFEYEVVLRGLRGAFVLTDGRVLTATALAVRADGTMDEPGLDGAAVTACLLTLLALAILLGRRLGMRLRIAGAGDPSALTRAERHPWLVLIVVAGSLDVGAVEIGSHAPGMFAWPDTAALLASLLLLTFMLLRIGLRVAYRVPFGLYRYALRSVPRARTASALLLGSGLTVWAAADPIPSLSLPPAIADARSPIREALVEAASGTDSGDDPQGVGGGGSDQSGGPSHGGGGGFLGFGGARPMDTCLKQLRAKEPCNNAWDRAVRGIPRQDADDRRHDALINLCKDSVPPTERLCGGFVTTVRRLNIKAYRRDWRWCALSEDEACDWPGADEGLIHRETAACVHQVYEKLERDEKALVDRYLGLDRSLVDIAAEDGRPASSVRREWWELRQKLRDEIRLSCQ